MSKLPDPIDEEGTYASAVARRLFARRGARLGAYWIALLGTVAVFAPFLASSHPLLLLDDGRWSSPVLRFLTPADLMLLMVFIALPIICCCAFGWRTKCVLLLAVALSGAALGHGLVQPPRLTIYEQYREALQADLYQFVAHAPIPYSPKDYLRDAGDTSLQEPLQSAQHTHWLGTDQNGADVLSRLLHATRIALGIGFVATGIALLLGVIIGGLMGYFSGVLDMLGMRLVEIFEAVPTLFLLLTFVAFFERSLYLMMVIIGFTSWPGYARYVRAEFLRLREQEFVQAAIVCGLPLHSILFRHMLPNAMAPLLVAASFGVASAILAESTLSFLGLGLVDDPSWGQMLNQAVQSSTFHWWMACFPGGAIFLTVLAYNLVGDALRDALDPSIERELD